MWSCSFFSVVICLLIFTNHASFRDKICLWNILSAFRKPPAGVSPLDPTGAAPRTPAPPSACTPSSVPPTTTCQQWLKSPKPPISMSSSDKIVYASRYQSDHASSRKVRSTWPKVIATESYLAITFGFVRRTWRSLRIPSLWSLYA